MFNSNQRQSICTNVLDKTQLTKGAYDMLFQSDGSPRLAGARVRLEGKEIASLRLIDDRKIKRPLAAAELEAGADGTVRIAYELAPFTWEIEGTAPWLNFTPATNGGAKATGMQKRTGIKTPQRRRTKAQMKAAGNGNATQQTAVN